MAQRRMFSPKIVGSDAFLDMPISSQALYFHLGMEADDDGFVNPRRIMRMIGTSEDDLKVLLAKRFLLPFDSGVVVIKHWLIHNLIRSDLYKETLYKNEKSSLGLNENGAYTELRVGISELKPVEAPRWLKIRRKSLRTANVPQTALRIGKVRLGKDSKTHVRSLPDSFEEFYKNYPRKIAREVAHRSWKKLNPPLELFQKILASIETHKKSKQWQESGGKFIPHPATWLNQRRWEDEVEITNKNQTIQIT